MMHDLCRLSLLFLALSGGACDRAQDASREAPPKTDSLRHVLIFAHATLEPSLNALVIERGVWPVMDCLTRAHSGVRFELVPLYDRTGAGTVLMQGELPPGLQGRKRATAVRNDFVARGRQLLDRLYADNAPQFLDVLGSLFVIDNYIARYEVTPQVIYASDMVQQTGEDGYDFSGQGNGRDMRSCQANLERDYGSKLKHRARMLGMRMDMIRLDLTYLARRTGKAPVTAEVLTPPNEIEAFWRDRVFGELLKARFTRHDAEGVDCESLGLPGR